MGSEESTCSLVCCDTQTIGSSSNTEARQTQQEDKLFEEFLQQSHCKDSKFWKDTLESNGMSLARMKDGQILFKVDDWSKLVPGLTQQKVEEDAKQIRAMLEAGKEREKERKMINKL